MKTYNVQIRVERDDNTDIIKIGTFQNIDEAKGCFSNELKRESGGQYLWENKFKKTYQEVLEIESINEYQDVETEIEEVIYFEGHKDKNNWKGNYANNYWTIAKHNGKELIYNFYDNSVDLNLEYSDVPQSGLQNWYSY